jgi:uracil phosphoribosyltransferase
MKNVTVIDHPLVQQNLARLRDKRTAPAEFRRALNEVSALMAYEATRSFAVERYRVTTPLTATTGLRIKREVILVPIMRAGLGMLDPMLQLIPDARVGFIGLRRDEKTLKPLPYHRSLPKGLTDFEVVLMDPMLATGGSAVAALDLLKERGAKHVRLVNLLAAPEGIRAVHRRYPALPIFTAAVDRCLNKRGFIVPGLGDAGDRLFGV